MHQSCFLKIPISQDWVDEFQISQSLWVRKALGHILRLSRFHNSCKQNFCVTKTPKIHLFFQFHITGTVAFMLSTAKKSTEHYSPLKIRLNEVFNECSFSLDFWSSERVPWSQIIARDVKVGSQLALLLLIQHNSLETSLSL